MTYALARDQGSGVAARRSRTKITHNILLKLIPLLALSLNSCLMTDWPPLQALEFIKWWPGGHQWQVESEICIHAISAQALWAFSCILAYSVQSIYIIHCDFNHMIWIHSAVIELVIFQWVNEGSFCFLVRGIEYINCTYSSKPFSLSVPI